MVYPARIRLVDNNAKIQTVSEHCGRTAEYAAANSQTKNTAYLAGLLHDMGKYSNEFRDYITAASRGENVRRGSVNHTFAGVRFILERWHNQSADDFHNITCELLAFAVGGHHGLFDCVDRDGRNGFDHRLTKEGIPYHDVTARYFEDCAGLAELDKLFELAVKEIEAVCKICIDINDKNDDVHFYISLLQRLLLSAVIDGDRRDTAEFMYDIKPPEFSDDIWENVQNRFEQRFRALKPASELDRIRSIISDECAKAANLPAGIYRLSLPTGGGKTLTGLRCELIVASMQQKKRVVYTAPLLTVLEQNAKVIRDWVGDDNLILEHHSNVVRTKNSDDELDVNELFMETWDAPIIITTLVQLLNTMFLGHTSCIRRMHALQDAVVIIDEVQSVPRNMLTLFNLALNFLSRVCNTTFVLCSATQPSLEYAAHRVLFNEPADLVTVQGDARNVFRRTQIIDKRRTGGYTPEELFGFMRECAEKHGSVLLVCNTKAQAQRVFATTIGTSGFDIFHLSAAMCMAHRINTFNDINNCLAGKKPVICISTQLVEAGVDFSFGCVLRISAGLDNVIQAAGRCNRNGEKDGLSPVYILDFRGEDLTHLKEIKEAQYAAEIVLRNFKSNPAQFDYDIASDAAITAYYEKLYHEMPLQAQDFHIGALRTSIYSMLSSNSAFTGTKKAKFKMQQAYKTAGNAFSVFDDNTQDVLVPYGNGEDCIIKLGSQQAEYSPEYRKEVLAQTKGYTVSLHEYEVKAIKKNGGIYSICDNAVLVLRPGFYSAKTGVTATAS